MDKCFEKLKDQLCDILHQYAEEGIKEPKDLEVVKNALSSIQKMQIIMEMKRYSTRSGFSRDDHEDGGSYRMKGGRSHDGEHDIKEKIVHLMEKASPEEREMLEKFIQQM